jgi:EAL domain-containing protein (putative c-di-GMP-specific phosphodiesterase class I)/DNA-binding response OmpR family regulator
VIAALTANARIFIVDDQPPNVRLLEQLLKRSGFTNTRSFGDGSSMLAVLDADEPDLVLLDLHMPAPDGFAVLETLRARARAEDFLPVLVLTADAERRARSVALAGGANDFLVKPLDTEEVVLRVRNLLETRHLHQALKARNADLVAEVLERTSDLRDSETQWTAVTQSLGRLEPLATPEATAEAISEALATLPDLALVAVVAFGATGDAVTLARRSKIDTGQGLGRPLNDRASARIRNLVGLGSWLGTQDALGEAAARRRWLDPRISGVALVPLRTSAGAVGALVAGTLVPDGISRLSRRIPALEAFAALASALLAPGIVARQRDAGLRAQIEAIIRNVDYRPVFQPIVALASGKVMGYEALTRFTDGVRPDRRFAGAEAVGLGLELEDACLTAAVNAAGQSLDETCWLSLNVSPALVLEHDRLARVLRSSRVPIVLEITEHAPIDDYAAFRSAIASLGSSVRCAIDDAGAGFSSFRHIIELRPAFVKLDIGLVRSIEQDPAREALVAGMAYFANKTGCELIAEGVETVAERDLLHLLSVGLAQGFLLGRPEPLHASTEARAPRPAPASPAPASDAVPSRARARRNGVIPLSV